MNEESEPGTSRKFISGRYNCYAIKYFDNNESMEETGNEEKVKPRIPRFEIGHLTSTIIRFTVQTYPCLRVINRQFTPGSNVYVRKSLRSTPTDRLVTHSKG